jgi:Cu-Zn family superoxide dismutase
MSRSFVLSLSVAIIVAACAPAPPEEAPVEPVGESSIALPADVAFPEGIAYDEAAGVFYTASAANGVLARVNATTGAGEIVSSAGVLMPSGATTFPGMLGMAIDSEGRLWMAGGRLGTLSVVDSQTGTIVRQQTVPSVGTSLINDVVVIEGSGYFTDTFHPMIWMVPVTGNEVGDLEPWLDLAGSVIEYGEGANLNGIAATADGRTLVVVQMAKGLLFRIDVATRAITPIDTAGADLTMADGLVLDGRTLYVVRQGAVEIATVLLSEDLSTGTVVSRFTDPALAWPATAALVGDRLLVVNTQFNTRSDNSETRPFTVASVPTAVLDGGS